MWKIRNAVPDFRFSVQKGRKSDQVCNLEFSRSKIALPCVPTRCAISGIRRRGGYIYVSANFRDRNRLITGIRSAPPLDSIYRTTHPRRRHRPGDSVRLNPHRPFLDRRPGLDDRSFRGKRLYVVSGGLHSFNTIPRARGPQVGRLTSIARGGSGEPPLPEQSHSRVAANQSVRVGGGGCPTVFFRRRS